MRNQTRLALLKPKEKKKRFTLASMKINPKDASAKLKYLNNDKLPFVYETTGVVV
jgi:hypothetical protein